MHQGSSFWRRVWEEKGAASPSDANFSGRSCYTQHHRMALVADAAIGLELKGEDSLLDLGCASGFSGYPLSKMVRQYVGLDYSMPALRFFGVNRSHRAKLIQALVTELPFADASFDKVYIGSVLLCLTKEEIRKTLTEMRRVTKVRAFIADTLLGEAGPCAHPEDPNCVCLSHVTGFKNGDELHSMCVTAGWVNIHFVPMHYSLPHSFMATDLILCA